MESGDLVLFYQSGNYVGAGLVGITFEDDDQWASKTLWNDAPSGLIYTIEEFISVSAPKEAVNQIFDYDETYTAQGLIRVAERRFDRHPTVIRRGLEKYTEKHAEDEIPVTNSRPAYSISGGCLTSIEIRTSILGLFKVIDESGQQKVYDPTRGRN